MPQNNWIGLRHDHVACCSMQQQKEDTKKLKSSRLEIVMISFAADSV
jgi:hypothetical protein